MKNEDNYKKKEIKVKSIDKQKKYSLDIMAHEFKKINEKRELMLEYKKQREK
jgi:hypothetical protein